DVAQDFQQPLTGVALMEAHWQLQFNRHRQMLFEHLFLLRAWREVAIEVQAAFTHGTHARLFEQAAQALSAIGVPVTGRVRVNPRRGEQSLPGFIQLLAQFKRLLTALDTGACEDQLADSGGIGAVEYGLVFVGKTWVGQVDADIDELHGATSDQRPESISEL